MPPQLVLGPHDELVTNRKPREPAMLPLTSTTASLIGSLQSIIVIISISIIIIIIITINIVIIIINNQQHKNVTVLSLWETTQTLFWASLGLISLDNFELAGIKVLFNVILPIVDHKQKLKKKKQEFTRFWGLVMFGTFSIINIIVLLNLLIAMMNHSYQVLR